MFGMSVTEIGIILVLALLLLGPDELPKLAKTVGKAMRELRKTTDDLKSTFEQEMVRFDDEPSVTPLLVPPPLDPGGAKTSGALDQLRDPAGASAALQTIAQPQPSDPGAARAAARLAAAGTQTGAKTGAQTGATTEPVSSAFWSESKAPASEVGSLAAVVVPGSADAPLASVAAPASTPLSDTAAGASATASAHALADSTAAPRAAAPAPRAPPSDTVPREKKPGPAA
jgi:sec-independent protein translocase protein TatB